MGRLTWGYIVMKSRTTDRLIKSQGYAVAGIIILIANFLILAVSPQIALATDQSPDSSIDLDTEPQTISIELEENNSSELDETTLVDDQEEILNDEPISTDTEESQEETESETNILQSSSFVDQNVQDGQTGEEIDNQPTIGANLTEVISAPTLVANVSCWTRTSINSFAFTISYTASADTMLENGSTYNNSDPAKYDAILPNQFLASETEIVIDGWDGEEFIWTLGNDQLTINKSGSTCIDQTLGDIIASDTNLSIFKTMIDSAIESEQCLWLNDYLYASNQMSTIFAPTNQAILGLVAQPQLIDNELNQLLANPDELCALIGGHIIEIEYALEFIQLDGDILNIFPIMNHLYMIVQRSNGRIFVDNAAIEEADIFASNGVLHTVDSVILPISYGRIDPITTNMTSPKITGSIKSATMDTSEKQYCVTVRIDGVPYLAVTEGNYWHIDAGVVSLNPTKSDTLFDVIVRAATGECSTDFSQENEMQSMSIRAFAAQDPVTYGGELVSLTMRKDVLTFEQPAMEEDTTDESTQVLGDSTTNSQAQSNNDHSTDITYSEVYQAGCGKGECVSINNTNQSGNNKQDSELDSDGDGAIDSEDPAPNDPNISSPADLENQSDNDTEEDDNKSDQNVVAWFIVGGGVALLWYLLWQRSGNEE